MTKRLSKSKSIPALALAIALVMSIVPAALAADSDYDNVITVSTGDELNAALSGAVSGSTLIKLATDIDAVSSATYAGYTANTTIAIDGQGHTINGNNIQDTGLRFGARGIEATFIIRDTVLTNMLNDDRNGGGAIAVWRGTVDISGCAFINNANNNETRGNGGGVMLQAGNGSLTISNSTFVANRAYANGGAIHSGVAGTLNNVTVVGNNSIATGVGGVNGPLTVTNSIISGNTTASETADANIGTTTVCDDGNNLIGVDMSGWIAASIDETSTLALLYTADSPAVDKGNPATAAAVDQRGILRDETPDIGAYELVKDSVDPNPEDGENVIDLIPAGVSFGILNFDLNTSFSKQKINLVEFTLKYDASKLSSVAVIPVEGLAIMRTDVDSDKGLVKIVAGVTNNDAIAYDGQITLAKIIITPKDGLTPDAAYISVNSGSIYSEGNTAPYSAINNAAYARFVYRNSLDINGDGQINCADLSLALYYFGASSTDTDWNMIGYADLNGDGIVDMLDITMLVDALYA